MKSMSSISRSVKVLLAVSACAACSDNSIESEADSVSQDDAGPKERDAGPKGPKDAGAGTESGRDAGGSASLSPDAGRSGGERATVNPGDSCDPQAFGGLGGLGGVCEGCTSGLCVARCIDGSYGPCRNVTEVIAELAGGGGSSPFGDGGLRDAGLTLDRDGSVTLPTLLCPAAYTCQPALIPNVAVGACLNQLALPALCETTEDCTAAGFTFAPCIDASSIPDLGVPLAFGFPLKYCASICSL
jgi:hypothetical protein